jgi:uncharacterized phiE125 gp8 family phage protein
MQKYAVTSAPAVEPVTAAELKLQTHVDHSAEDALLASYIITARTLVEQWTGRALITQTRKVLYQVYATEYLLPGAPAQSVTSLKVANTAGVQTLVAAGNYILDTVFGRLLIRPDGTLPAIDLQYVDAVEIIYVCGYGASSASVPEPLRQAIMMLAAHFYANREAVSVGNTSAIASAPVAYGVDSLIEPYRLFFFPTVYFS